MESYVVIGGGLAGLTVANALAGQGDRVTLLEQSAHLGGRARTHREKGYSFNLGPHALYPGGRARQTFREWKIPLSGGFPPTSLKAYFVRAGRFYPMITSLRGLLTTRMFNVREKLEVAGLQRLFGAGHAGSTDTMAEWIDRHVSSPYVREFAATVTRISTFATDLDHLSARLALAQIASALKHNVRYLDGGWQTLVDGLADRARFLGVEIRCGESVNRLDTIDATGIVLAVGPDAVQKLTGVSIPAGLPVRMATLDLGLRGMSENTTNVAFATDRPLYFSVHSASARLAPEGGRMVHVSKYLGAAEEDAKALRAELEEFSTLVMPTWRQHTEFMRFLPDLTVTPMLPTPAGRPGVNFLNKSGVAIAGDWVGGESMLSDAAVASALEAANTIRGRKAAAA